MLSEGYLKVMPNNSGDSSRKKGEEAEDVRCDTNHGTGIVPLGRRCFSLFDNEIPNLHQEWKIMKELEVKNLYTLTETLAAPLLSRVTYPWEALPVSDFTFEVIEPAPIWALNPKIESPT